MGHRGLCEKGGCLEKDPCDHGGKDDLGCMGHGALTPETFQRELTLLKDRRSPTYDDQLKDFMTLIVV